MSLIASLGAMVGIGSEKEGGSIAEPDNTKIAKEAIQKCVQSIKFFGWTVEYAFNYFDVDGSGSITRVELRDGFNKLWKEMTGGVLESQIVKEMFKIFDRNFDDQITFREFNKVLQDEFNLIGQHLEKAPFSSLDA